MRITRPPGPAAPRGPLQAFPAFAVFLGCAASPLSGALPEPRPLGGELPSYRAPAEPGERPTHERPPPPEPAGPITLAEALALALEKSPDLASFAWEVRVREAEALQAGLRPNPELGLEVEDFGGSGELRGFDGAETKLLLLQRIETASKRPKRRRAAELDAAVAGWEYEEARLAVFAEVVEAFAEVLAAQERVELTAELVRVSESSVEAVGRLVSAGATSPIERTRAEVEAAAARVDLAVGRRSLESARARLAATWGGLGARFERAEGDLGAVAEPPELDLVRGWLARNPELARWNQEIERREAVVELERARRIPDVTVGAGPRRLSEVDETAFAAELSLPIPLFDRNQGALAAARSDLRKAVHERRAAEAHLAAALESAYQELAARHEEVRELREEILPDAEEAFEGVRGGYLRGLFRNVDVLDAQRRLFELRLREIEALRGYHVAEAEIERITGTPLVPLPGGTGAP